ncbi:MAG: hypothetical protein AB4352_27545 [Hormoscilla sp.]
MPPEFPHSREAPASDWAFPGSSDENIDETWVLGHRVRLNFVTTFADRSMLLTRLDAAKRHQLTRGLGGP